MINFDLTKKKGFTSLTNASLSKEDTNRETSVFTNIRKLLSLLTAGMSYRTARAPHLRLCGQLTGQPRVFSPLLSLFHPSPRTVLSPGQNCFFFLKKKKPKCPKKQENSRNGVSSGVGKGTRHVPVLPKDYHTAVAELETNDLLKVR